jgi:hypothetical protein
MSSGCCTSEGCSRSRSGGDPSRGLMSCGSRGGVDAGVVMLWVWGDHQQSMSSFVQQVALPMMRRIT